MYAVPFHPEPIHKRSRRPLSGFDGPPYIARQIDAAFNLAPAEAYRGETALLLCCGPAPERSQAEEALRDLWPVDTVYTVPCPIGSWAEALVEEPEASSWLRHYVVRAIQRHNPSVVVLLNPSQGESSADADAVVRGFYRWGLGVPIGALRVDESVAVEWLVTPQTALEDTG